MVDFKLGHAELAEKGTGILLIGIVFINIVLPLMCFSIAVCLGCAFAAVWLYT